MTIEEWAKDFKSYVNALDMPRDDYKGIMEYIDDALELLKEQPQIVRCKDCIFSEQINDRYICINAGHCQSKSNAQDWFCADGVKKE